MKQQSSIKLKVCGMREAENILAVAALQPDFMGFIFYDQSPRYVGRDFKIPAAFPNTIYRVGVFVNEETDRMIALLKKHQLDYLQLHGTESVEQVKALHDLNFKVIKVFSIDDEFDFTITRDYHPYCDYFLFDTKGKFYGGNAEVFNWDQLTNYDQQLPFFLSGGLNSENVKQVNAMKGLNLFALDMNSGVEVSPGTKDCKKIKQVIEIVKITEQ
jgi:phosphoribosylanthranilate isomerase